MKWRRELIGGMSIIAAGILTAMKAISGEQFVTIVSTVLGLYTTSRVVIKDGQS